MAGTTRPPVKTDVVESRKSGGKPRFIVDVRFLGNPPPRINDFDLAALHEWLRSKGYKFDGS
jgi:hypothetical protein